MSMYGSYINKYKLLLITINSEKVPFLSFPILRFPTNQFWPEIAFIRVELEV